MLAACCRSPGHLAKLLVKGPSIRAAPNADSLEEAESLVRDMPIIESVRVYEAHSM
jgi:hypothetical protein